jgi:hypothetical protein
MSNFDAMWAMNDAHHKELLQVAETQRSFARVHKLPQKNRARALHFVGDVLIAVGSRLKARNTFATHKVT